jgi:AcrR family transcriptional regulator
MRPRSRRTSLGRVGVPDSALASGDDTQARVLAAASELFADHGFARTTIREIAERAGVNVAAGHYHFGSKRELYLAVARTQFDTLDARIAAANADADENALEALSRDALGALLGRRIQAMLLFLLGPPPSPHGAIMLGELSHPTDALPVIVREYVRPQQQRVAKIISHLAPSLDARSVQQCCFSIVSQVFFQRLMLPAMPDLMGVASLPRNHVQRTAEHITAFALAAIAGLERASRALRAPTPARENRKP